jgi:hypothetical protein
MNRRGPASRSFGPACASWRETFARHRRGDGGRTGDAQDLVRSEEQISECVAPPVGYPPLQAVVLPVVHEVAALTQRMQVPHPIVARVVVEVGCGQNDPRDPTFRHFDQIRP